jgi:RimJ/RimL family protein N-acetyltransferase
MEYSLVHLVKAFTKHVQFLYDLYADPQVREGHGLRVPIAGSQWRNIVQGIYDGWQHTYIVHYGEMPVGHIALQDVNFEDKRAEVSFAVLPSMQGRGVGQEALKQVLDLAFKPANEGGLDLHCVYACTPEYNTSSQSLLERFKFKQSGKIFDYYKQGSSRHSKLFYTCLRSK